MYQKEFMELAIDEARAGILNGDGGPFGAVIVKDDSVVASGYNQVIKNSDSTDHGEIDAIRKAERALGTYDLSGCVIYTTGEPCPMCLAAILWANIEKVYYGCTIKDSEKLGFRDDELDAVMGRRANVPEGFMEEKERETCLQLFDEYDKMANKIIY